MSDAKTFFEANPPATLATIANGAAADLFALELERVLRNAIDPNTVIGGKREITLKFGFEVTENRDAVHITVECSSRLAGSLGSRGLVFCGQSRTGEVVAVCHDPQQMQIQFEGAPARPTVLAGAAPETAAKRVAQ